MKYLLQTIIARLLFEGIQNIIKIYISLLFIIHCVTPLCVNMTWTFTQLKSCTYRFPEQTTRAWFTSCTYTWSKTLSVLAQLTRLIREILCAHTQIKLIEIRLTNYPENSAAYQWRCWSNKRNLRTMVKNQTRTCTGLLVNGSFAFFTSCRRSWLPETNKQEPYLSQHTYSLL